VSRKLPLTLALSFGLLKDFMDFDQRETLGENTKAEKVSNPRAWG
jgi:hypothetical protein